MPLARSSEPRKNLLPSPPHIITPELISVGAAVVSTAFAGYQIMHARRESIAARDEARARTTFEHLRSIEPRVHAMRAVDLSDIQEATVAYYEGTGDATPAVQSYLMLLDSLEMLALARAKRIADADLADEYLKSLVRDDVISTATIDRIQTSWSDPGIYARLRALIAEYAARSKALPPA